MASSSSSSSYLIRFHRGGVFVRDHFSYDYEMLSEIPNVDMGAMNFVGFVKLLVSECSSDIKQIFYHVAGLSLELGLRTLKNDEDLAKCVELGAQNDNVLDIYFSTDKACDAVENGISECFNTMIVDARRKLIINMLEDIRVLCMERLQKIKEKHAKWTDDIEMSFQVVRAVAIYFLHKDHENYVFDWYNKNVFVNAYNHYIEGVNGMDQWPTTDYQKPLPPVVRRMPGRPPHKRKRDVMEDDGNRTRISRKGQLNHCTLCKKPGHNQRACPSKPEVTAAGEIVTASVGKVTATGEIVTASGGNVTTSGDLISANGENVTARGGKVCARGGKVTARGGIVMASRGNVSAKGGKVTASGGKVTAREGKVSARGGKVSASAVRTSGCAIKLREGVWIRSPEKQRSSYADTRRQHQQAKDSQWQ
ncbi:multidrug resistance-associated protein 5, partial [Tanacetum coccineum]